MKYLFVFLVGVSALAQSQAIAREHIVCVMVKNGGEPFTQKFWFDEGDIEQIAEKLEGDVYVLHMGKKGLAVEIVGPDDTIWTVGGNSDSISIKDENLEVSCKLERN